MYISDLELHGFKSFAHKTHVKFDNGITAIVGPNGCGKSNIVDALRWVLGEQRPTLLRSSSMSNVIFNGTAQKKALGMADVSLTFVNNKGVLPVEYSELTITRRLYRSGDSEYLINNTPCRLKDIMELFMDTGMSSDAYSVIELKMVEEILNDRNNDRRRLFEEAAGVTRYKEKRKQTLRKLDETMKDLTRLEDILVEIRKKARSLEIQAQKAEKAKKLKKELEHLDKAYTLHEYKAIKEELDPLDTKIKNAEKEKVEIADRLKELEADEEKARTKLLEKERNESEAKRRVSQLSSAIRELETSLQITNEKISNEEGVINQYESDIEQSRVDIKELAELKKSNETKLEKLTEEKDRSERALSDSKEKFSGIQQKYTKVRHELYELEIEISDVNQKLTNLQSNRIKLESRLENSEDDQDRIDQDIANIEKEIRTAKEKLEEARKQSEKMNFRIDELEEQLQTSTSSKSELEEKRESLREELRSVKSKKDAVSSEISLLQGIAESNEAMPASVSYLIENHKNEFKLLKPVGELLQTAEEYAPALDTALGDAVNFIVTESLEEAIRASEILKENDKGRATFIPLAELNDSYPAESGSIVEHVWFDDEYKPVAQLLLGSVLISDSIEEGVKLLKKSGTSAVTSTGDLITSDRILKSGSKNKQAGIRLGLQDKLNKLKKKEYNLEASLVSKEDSLDEINRDLERIDLDSIRQSIRDLQKTNRELDQQVSRYQSSIQVYGKNIGDLQNRKDKLAGNRDMAIEELENLQPKQKEFQRKITELDQQQKEKKETLQNLEEERAIAQNRYNDAQLKHQDLSNKTDNLIKDIERAESGIENMKSRQESRSELLGQSKEKIAGYRSSIKETEANLGKAKTQKKEADEKLSIAEEESSRQRGKINEVEKELKELRKRKEVNLELVHHLTMAKEKFELKAEGLSDHIWETYEILMDQLGEELPADMEPEEAKSRVTTLRQKLHRIGDVNPLAIEEFREEKERLEFHEEQITDLHEAEKEMRETIAEINETATERFNKTFEQIRENFKNVFSTLFHEDDFCDLVIQEDPEDPLEAKIEIRANPKGKRPSSINQLSGGEKTLTAIALLFAIYLVKPSPFCVLDEVDAPLDDANIERFSSMIKTFSKETQFIIITHNKKTMSKAEMMYGVTMPETGVSRLVGVKLDEVETV
ncbi:chromosome segregation protein SMC [Rhodohalobacter sp. 614A]|uniref:chromosome segregation protein SMC n=1 Tax=Rhodohalobacter sp. 614A TaxID=2908649 RepID=UPI001F313618|nr:chromosome segregation protein SMC [Rhodohalobacter sp. 614A]